MLTDLIKIDTLEYSKGGLYPKAVYVSAEYPVTIIVNGNLHFSIVCSGSDLEVLVIGYLISERIINSINEIKEIDIGEDNLKINVKTEINDDIRKKLNKPYTIDCNNHDYNMCFELKNKKKETPPSVKAETIISCMKKFLHSSRLHKRTRGVHSAALYTKEGEVIVFFDEIGRHNAIDKIVGHALKNGISLSDKMIFLTGRLSSEIVYKALYASAPIIVSKASPTSLAVELARKHNLVMIGKVGGNNFCIFNGEDKII